MSKKLLISDTLSLPLDAATQKLAWLGRTGSGKTFACKKLVEQMLRADVQVVILDGVGVWPGLRLGPKSFDIPVLGGLYGDIPLESTAGALVADIIVDSGTSMVLDVSQMLDAERTRFATAFGQRFFQRKKSAPSAVHLVLEECQDYVPQNFQHGEERMLHEFQRIAKQGRSFGIGLSLISQRPQEIAKKALNQTECVFAFQMTGPQERKALEYWLSDKGFDGKLSDILPRLEVGSPHVWSPQWLKISKVVHILPIDSLDTSSTPKVGEKAFKQKKLTPIDLKSLNVAMAETVERAKAEDPKELRKRIAELEKELTKKNSAVKPTVVEKSVPVDWKWLTREVEAAIGDLDKRVSNAMCDAEVLNTKRPDAVASTQFDGKMVAPQRTAAPKTNGSSLKPYDNRIHNALVNSSSVGGGLRRMMIALAQRPRLTNRQLGVRAGLSSRSGTFSTYLSRGRSEGWIADEGEKRSLTEKGLAALGDFEPLPEGRELLRYWLHELGGGASRMLAALGEAYPRNLTNEQLGEAAEISHRSGTFSTYLSRMRTLELVEGRGELRLSEELVG